jgi:hypothetical protein
MVVVFRTLFDHTGDTSRLEEAVKISRAALAATPDGHPGHTTAVSNLVGALNMLAEHTEGTAVLQEAVDIGRAARPNGRSDTALLNNVGNALQTLYVRTGDADALAEALQMRRAAVAAIPDAHRDRALVLSNLVGAL